MLHAFASTLRRGIGRSLSGAAGAGELLRRPGAAAAAVVAVAVTGIAAGSGLGIWLVPSLSLFTSSSSSSLDFSDGESEKQVAVGVDPLPPQEKKPRFLLSESFRRRVFFNYERRLRMRSPPEKIFEYFASVQSPDGEIFMSPADLMRAVVPVFPPSESNIVREGYLRGEPHFGELHCAASNFFMLFDTNNDGLISFPEYIFFVTMLSIPDASFSVAFKMFDVDNNGEIERDEFKKMMKLMRSYNRQGSCHRDGVRIGLKVGRSVENAGILEYFFGKDGKGRLQHDEFVRFLRKLHDEILRLEFGHYDFNSRGTISARDFALSMVASADINHINRFLNRVDQLNDSPHLKVMRISFEEFKAFADLRRRLQQLAFALRSYGEVYGLLTKQDFKRAAFNVCGVSVTDNMVDVIFFIFDTNNDGSLSSEEFLRALQRRESDIRQPTLMGIRDLLPCWWNCKKARSLPVSP